MNQNRMRALVFAVVVVAAMFFGGVVGATVLSKSALSTVNAATASPTPRSNEAATHESGESAAQETAENNGTAHPNGPGSGPSNETAAHEAGESAAREASEKT